jgi:signal transduction histidine kinase
MASLFVVCTIAFRVDAKTIGSGFLPAVLYSPLPLILWAAIRFGERGASGTIVVVTIVAIWQNLHAATVFMGLDPGTSVLALQIFLLGIAVPLMFLGTAIAELRRSADATRRLAGALLQAQDEERRRIARELHDSTGQQLAMANFMAGQIQSLAPPSCDPPIAELRDMLQRVHTEIRTVSYLLHPPLLDVGGLRLALQSYLDGFSERTGINVESEVSPDLGRLPSDVELALFRVVQESLTNVWRHSGSATARIQLSRQVAAGQAKIILGIEDAGKGIPEYVYRPSFVLGKSTRVQPGVGLMGMRERMRQIGGRLEIESTTGKTVIQATVTLPSESAAVDEKK